MVNLQEDAFPSTISYSDESPEVLIKTGGFTKLEYASLLMAQAYTSNGSYNSKSYPQVSKWAVELAKAVLEEANK